MKALFRDLFSRRNKKKTISRRRKRGTNRLFRAGLEALEAREVPAGIFAVNVFEI